MQLKEEPLMQAVTGALSPTRRSILQNTGWLLAASLLPSRIGNAANIQAKAADVSAPSVITTLSTYMSEAGSRALPPEVVEKTKQHILDTIAAMISGSDLPPGKVALKFAWTYGGEKVATV